LGTGSNGSHGSRAPKTEERTSHTTSPYQSSSAIQLTACWYCSPRDIRLIVDSPSRRVVERRNGISQYDNDFIDVEVVSSPPSRPKSPVDDEITLVSFEPFQEYSTVTPIALGGSKFRRKQIIPGDISSPVTVSATHGIDLPSIPLFELEESIPTASSSDSQQSIPSPPRHVPSTSTSLPPLPSYRQTLKACTSSGKVISITKKPEWKKIIAAQEKQDAIKARKEAYYGVDIHRLLDNIEATPHQSQFLTYESLIPPLIPEPIPMHLEIHAKISGQINTAPKSSSTYSATNVSIATSCAG